MGIPREMAGMCIGVSGILERIIIRGGIPVEHNLLQITLLPV